MEIMVSMTHTMTLGRSEKKISRTVGRSFAPKKLTFFAFIATKPVDIMFEQNKCKRG